MTHSKLLSVGIALIAGPLLAVGLRILTPGWLLVLLIVGLVVIVPAYVLQIVIAVTGFLVPRALFPTSGTVHRAIIAGWMAALSPVIAGLFALDANDGGPLASPFLRLIGGGYEWESVVNGIAVIALSATVAGWAWLVVEWGIALRVRRRATAVR